jgi:hypothetical protein
MQLHCVHGVLKRHAIAAEDVVYIKYSYSAYCMPMLVIVVTVIVYCTSLHLLFLYVHIRGGGPLCLYKHSIKQHRSQTVPYECR